MIATQSIEIPYGSQTVGSGSAEYAASLLVTGGATLEAPSSWSVSGSTLFTNGSTSYFTGNPMNTTLDFRTVSVDGGSSVTFAPPVTIVGTLTLSNAARMTAQNGLSVSSVIIVMGGATLDVWGYLTIAGVSYASAMTAIAAGALVVNNGGTVTFHAASPACYARDTVIRTYNGYRPVQDIKAGNILFGGNVVVWVGKRTVNFAEMDDPEPHWPCVLGDLIVSPEHCMLVGNTFVPACETPGAHRLTGITSIEYWHIQTETHCVIWADGFESESFLDDGHRADMETVSGERLPGRFTWDDACYPLRELVA